MIEIYNKLRDYQKLGVNFLTDRNLALLSDEMGLGKTIQVAVAIELLLIEKRVKSILIVCPNSLTLNWERELNLWSPSSTVRRVFGNLEDRQGHYLLPFSVWITTFELIRTDISFLSKFCTYDLVILDEAQKIKNIDSQTAIACRQLKRIKSWAITGTPVENSLEDLNSIFSFLKLPVVLKGKSIIEIHQIIKPYFLRRTKKEVLNQLPPIIEKEILLELTEMQQISYDNEVGKIHSEYTEMNGNLSNANLFSKISKLKQICNFDPISLMSSKFEALKIILENAMHEKKKVIIFSQYVKSLEILHSKMEWPALIFHGGLNPEKKSEVVKLFEESDHPTVLLISLKAGGVGLNLNSASIAILFDRWWNPASEKQALQRAHRFGKKESLYAIKFLVKNTIEDKINEILNYKLDVFEHAIENAPIAQISALTKDEILSILKLK